MPRSKRFAFCKLLSKKLRGLIRLCLYGYIVLFVWFFNVTFSCIGVYHDVIFIVAKYIMNVFFLKSEEILLIVDCFFKLGFEVFVVFWSSEGICFAITTYL